MVSPHPPGDRGGGEAGERGDDRRTASLLLLVVVFLVWSHSFIAARLLVGEEVPADERLGPAAFVVARFLPVFAVCAGYFLVRPAGRREARRILRRAPWLVALLAALNVWGYNLPFAAGQHRVPPGTAALVITLNPIFTFLLALALGQERFSPRRLAGLAVAFAGVWQVVVHGAGASVGAAYLADALLLCLAPVSWALYTVLGKRLLGGVSPLVLTYLVLALGSAPTLLVAAAHPTLAGTVSRWGAERWAAALFLGLVCSVLAYWWWFVALRHLAATTVAAFVFLNPPLTIFFEWLWFGRRPSWGLLGGGLAVVAGVWLTVVAGRGRGAAAGRAGPARPAARLE